MKKCFRIQYILVLSFLIETICVTYVISFPSCIPIASIVYFIAGITIGLLFLVMPQSDLKFTIQSKYFTSVIVYKLILSAIIGIIIYHFTKNWIIKTPLTIYNADMLPIMKVMNQRFLNGEWQSVYAPIQEIWNGIQPIYLPAMWLPFSIAVAGNFDLRWITSVGLFFSFLLFLFLFTTAKKRILSGLLLFGVFILFWWLLTAEVHNFIRLSEEGIIVFYFSLLTIALLTENYFAIGLCAALCALSRYSLAGWLPAMILYLIFIKKNKKALLVFIATGVGLFILLVILPFGWKVLPIFLSLPTQYIEHANRVWKDNPEFFKESMGFAKFFGPLQSRLLHQVLITVSFVLPSLFIVACYFLQKIKRGYLSNIPLACLKFSLVIFYSFLDVPYLYLFYVSSFVSLIAISYFIYRNAKEGNLTVTNL